MADNDSKIVLWLRQRDPEWGKLSYRDALSKWLRYQTSGSPEVENYITQVKQSYAQSIPAPQTVTPQVPVQEAPPTQTQPTPGAYPGALPNQQFPQAEGENPIMPTGFAGWDYITDKSGKSWLILLPDLQYVDMLTPQTATYLYENIMVWDPMTGQRRIMTPQEKSDVKLDSKAFYDQVAYQSLSNELIQSGVSEEDLAIPVVQQWVQEQMGNVRVGKGVDYAKESEWIKQVSAYNKMTTEAEAAWKVEQATPPSAKPWYKPPEPWKPLVQKAINRPERMTSL